MIPSVRCVVVSPTYPVRKHAMGLLVVVSAFGISAGLAADLPARDLVVEVADLPLNPRVILDANVEPPRPVAFLRDHSPGEPRPPWPYWISVRELYRDGKIQEEEYLWPGAVLADWMEDDRRTVRGSKPTDWAEQLRERHYRTPELAARNVHTAGVLEVLAREAGFDAEGLPLDMLTMRPIEWFRGNPRVDGPYFLLVHAVSASVGNLTVVDANTENPYSSTFRPDLRVGNQVIILETVDPIGPSRVFSTLRYGNQNLAVLRPGQAPEFAAGGFPLAPHESHPGPGVDVVDLNERAVVELRKLLSGNQR